MGFVFKGEAVREHLLWLLDPSRRSR